jgi:hypothetical protein
MDTGSDEIYYHSNDDIINSHIIEYYKNNTDSLMTLLDIIHTKALKMPLRLIEWFVTNYAKKYAVKYKYNMTYGAVTKNVLFDVHVSYKAQLKGKHKNNFDPFCRGPTVKFSCNHPRTGDIIEFISSYKQLKFFKWAIENKIIIYISKYIKEINADMIQNTPKNNISKSLDSTISDSSSRKSKSELSQSSYMIFDVTNTNNVEII